MNEEIKKVKSECQDESATVGCPSLGVPKIPSGADGVEPMMRTNWEEIMADVFHKCNESFIHAPHQREARPGYFKVAVGDIADALGSVVPCERSARGADPTDAPLYVTPKPVAGSAQSEMQRMEARNARNIHWQVFSTKLDITVMGRRNDNGKVYEIRIQKRKDPKAQTEFYCVVNGTTVMDGTFIGNSWMAKRMLESALQSLVNYKALHRRMRCLANKRRAGMLTPDQEVAATVARQMDDDELAEQIENA